MSEAKHTGPRDSSLRWLVVAAYAVTASRKTSEAFHRDGFGISVATGHVILSCKIWNNYPILH